MEDEAVAPTQLKRINIKKIKDMSSTRQQVRTILDIFEWLDFTLCRVYDAEAIPASLQHLLEDVEQDDS